MNTSYNLIPLYEIHVIFVLYLTALHSDKINLLKPTSVRAPLYNIVYIHTF